MLCNNEPEPVSMTCEEKLMAMKSDILLHPYFKNPSRYPVRLLTILKYLKKKGHDVSDNNIDEIVDELILSIEGVRAISFGKYNITKQKNNN